MLNYFLFAKIQCFSIKWNNKFGRKEEKGEKEKKQRVHKDRGG